MTDRILRINELIRQEVNRLFLTEIDFPIGCLVTIVKVQTAQDLRYCRIYISILPVKYTAKVLAILQKNTGHLQFLLNKKLAMKPLPQISFKVDRTEKEASDIEKLLDNLKRLQ